MKELRIEMSAEIFQLDFMREQLTTLELATRRSGLSQTAKPLIQRVPRVIRRLKEDSMEYFEPVQVAIGPLHHGNEKCQPAELTKLKLAALFVLENESPDVALLDKIKTDIEDLRKCYNEENTKDYNDDELARMFFVDGCALLKTLDSVHQSWSYYGSDITGIYILDLLLLENQLPYRVLKILIGSTKDPQRWEKSIADFIDGNLTTYGGRIQHKEEERQDYVHLLERMRTKLLSGKVEKSSCSMIGSMILKWGASRKDWKTFHGIMELKQSGIRVSPSSTNNIKNISFHCNFLGCLKMPPLVVDDSTASKFMSLVAFEMCPGFKNDSEVTSYLCFLGSLIQTAEDVKELRVTGMLHNYFGDDEQVAALFRRMCRFLQPNQEMHIDVMKKIHRYRNSWVIWIYSHYFSSNWSFLAFTGAIAGLVLTLIETYYTIKKKVNNTSI